VPDQNDFEFFSLFESMTQLTSFSLHLRILFPIRFPVLKQVKQLKQKKNSPSFDPKKIRNCKKISNP